MLFSSRHQAMRRAGRYARGLTLRAATAAAQPHAPTYCLILDRAMVAEAVGHVGSNDFNLKERNALSFVEEMPHSTCAPQVAGLFLGVSSVLRFAALNVCRHRYIHLLLHAPLSSGGFFSDEEVARFFGRKAPCRHFCDRCCGLSSSCHDTSDATRAATAASQSLEDVRRELSAFDVSCGLSRVPACAAARVAEVSPCLPSFYSSQSSWRLHPCCWCHHAQHLQHPRKLQDRCRCPLQQSLLLLLPLHERRSPTTFSYTDNRKSMLVHKTTRFMRSVPRRTL